MRYQDIRAGDRLRLKRDNPYGLEPMVLTVLDVRARDGYKVPWIVCEDQRVPLDMQGRDGMLYFKPSDFAGRADN